MLWNAINGQRTWRICYFSDQKAEYGRAPLNIDQESDLLFDVEDKSIAEKLFQNLSNTIEKRSYDYVNRYVKTDMEIASIIFDKKRKIRWSGTKGNNYISYFQGD